MSFSSGNSNQEKERYDKFIKGGYVFDCDKKKCDHKNDLHKHFKSLDEIEIKGLETLEEEIKYLLKKNGECTHITNIRKENRN
jgi:hypothetical protein